MNEKYVTDLEHSRKLVAAGWTRRTCWVRTWQDIVTWYPDEDSPAVKKLGTEFWPAPLTDELLEELKELTSIVIFSGDGISIEGGRREFKGTPPNALADLWCWWKGEEAK